MRTTTTVKTEYEKYKCWSDCLCVCMWVYICMIGVKEFPSHRAQKTRYKHVFILYACT